MVTPLILPHTRNLIIFIGPIKSISLFFILLISFNPIITSSTCPTNITNCLRCFDDTSCSICFEGFRLNSVFTCSPCSQGCAICVHASSSCNKYKLGTGLFNLTRQLCQVHNCAYCQNNLSSCNKCLDGYENISSTTCQPCFDANCKKCQNQTTCIECHQGYLFQSSTCVSCNISNCKRCSSGSCESCEDNFGVINQTCVICLDRACKVCTGNASQCTQCEVRYGLQNIQKICLKCNDSKCINCSLDYKNCSQCEKINYLTTINGECKPCSVPNCIVCFYDDICTNCIGIYGVQSLNNSCLPCSDSNCSDCSKKYSDCVLCRSGYGLETNKTCTLCTLSPSFCRTCSRKNLKICQKCQQRRYPDSGNVCQLCPNQCNSCYLDQNLNQVNCTSCLSGFMLYQDVPNLQLRCQAICGDFQILDDEQCDNEIGRLFDGCTDECKIEQNFTCFYQGKSLCSFNNTVILQFLNITQNENNFILIVSVWPPLYIFSVTEKQRIKELFNVDSNKVIIENVQFNNEFNMIKFYGKITQDINSGESINIKFMPSKMVEFIEYSQTPNQVLPILFEQPFIFIFDPLIYIVMSISYILTGFSWLSFIIGAILRKVPGLQAIFVIQTAYITLVCTNSSLLGLFQRAYPLKYASGYSFEFVKEDQKLQSKQSFYPHLKQYKLSELYLSNNFNINLIFQIVLVIALIFFYCRLRKCIKQSKQQAGQKKESMTKEQAQVKLIQLQNYYDKYERLYQLLMKFILANLVYFFACSAIFFKYGLVTHIPSLIIFAIQTSLTIVTLLKFYFDPVVFDYFRFSFKSTRLAMHHYFFHILNIILIVITLCLFQKTWIPLIPVSVMLIYTLVYRPYKRMQDNIRSAINMTAIISFLMFRVYLQLICKCTTQYEMKLMSYGIRIFYMVNLVGVLPVVVLVSIFMSIWQFYNDYVQEQQQLKEQQQTGKKKQKNHRYLLSQLVKIDPNCIMSDLKFESTFMNIIGPQKSLLAATKQATGKKLQNIKLNVSQKVKINKQQKKCQKQAEKEQELFNFNFKQNQLCERNLLNFAKYLQKEDQIAAEIIKNEHQYIYLQSSMRIGRKAMQTQEDLMAAQEYNKIDVSYLRDNSKNGFDES